MRGDSVAAKCRSVLFPEFSHGHVNIEVFLFQQLLSFSIDGSAVEGSVMQRTNSQRTTD